VFYLQAVTDAGHFADNEMDSDNNAILELESGKKKSPSRIKREIVNQAEITKLTQSEKFSSRLLISPRTGRPFYYFRYHGQTLGGFLMDRVWDNSALNRSRSFCIITDDGTKEEFFANQRLARIIHKENLWGKYIEITYIGDERTGYGHARKIYQVAKIGGITDNVSGNYITEFVKGRSNEPRKQSTAKTQKTSAYSASNGR